MASLVPCASLVAHAPAPQDPYDMSCVRTMHESASEISAMTFYEAWNILVTGARAAAACISGASTAAQAALVLVL